MDATTASSIIAGPLGDVAGNFNFSKQASARSEAIGLDAVSLYAAGRASMLGGVDPEVADAVFYFFKPGMIAAVVSRGRSLASEDAIATAHLGSADDYAEATFAAFGLLERTPSGDIERRGAAAQVAKSRPWEIFQHDLIERPQ